jgi:hypothetical protein
MQKGQGNSMTAGTKFHKPHCEVLMVGGDEEPPVPSVTMGGDEPVAEPGITSSL